MQLDGEHFLIDQASPVNLPIGSEPLKAKCGRLFRAVMCIPTITDINEAIAVQQVLEILQDNLIDTSLKSLANSEQKYTMSIAFIDLKAQQMRIRDKIEAGFRMVLDHGAYIMGPEITALETRLGDWTKATHNITCSSGTDALLLTLMGLELKAGQGVIVPSFTFAASAEVMPCMGAIPVLPKLKAIVST